MIAAASERVHHAGLGQPDPPTRDRAGTRSAYPGPADGRSPTGSRSASRSAAPPPAGGASGRRTRARDLRHHDVAELGTGRGFENAATASAISLPCCSIRQVHVVSERPTRSMHGAELDVALRRRARVVDRERARCPLGVVDRVRERAQDDRGEVAAVRAAHDPPARRHRRRVAAGIASLVIAVSRSKVVSTGRGA